jgi:hypothetical protein
MQCREFTVLPVHQSAVCHSLYATTLMLRFPAPLARQVRHHGLPIYNSTPPQKRQTARRGSILSPESMIVVL